MKMSSQASTVNMEVPSNMVEKLRLFMEEIQLNAVERQPDMIVDDEKQDEQEGGVEREVSRVTSHRQRIDGGWQFQILWKGYRKREWVDDEECNCEELIAEYLRDKGISTAYLFCRVSTKEQAQSTNVSLGAQEAELRRAASGMVQFTRIRVYSISQSAYRRIPSALQKIGHAALRGDGILVWRVDRLSRNIEDYMEWFKDLHARGVMLYSHQEGINYENNKLSFLQAVLNAQKDSEILGERVKMAYRRKRERGDHCVGGLPYGKRYKRVLNRDGSTHHKEIEDHPQEQAIIQRIRHDQRKASVIAAELNAEGIKKKNHKWNRMIVLRVKKNR